MKKRSWQSVAKALVVVIGIALVANPEVRAILFFADAVGFDIFLLLIVTQARNIVPLIKWCGVCALRTTCHLAALISRVSFRVLSYLLVVEGLTIFACPMLFVSAVRLQCTYKAQV
jgi:hypothetical protein